MTEVNRVLLVEDEPMIRFHVATSLQDSGFETVEATDGEEALQALDAARPIQVLLTDITLPGDMDGFGLIERIGELYPELPIIMMSGRYTASALPDRFKKLPFFAKPFDVNALISCIQNLLSK